MACTAIYHLVELTHENYGLAGAWTMVAVENDRCLLFEDHVQGDLMALMGVDEAAYSTRNNPISVEREPLRDYAPKSGVQPNNLNLVRVAPDCNRSSVSYTHLTLPTIHSV